MSGGVYPRAYGGTCRDSRAAHMDANLGLSPRVRGNPRSRPARAIPVRQPGSIPARTGEPTALQATLSPRVRGNPYKRSPTSHDIPRSIPARTGEPPTKAGSSPRVRGNLNLHRGDSKVYGVRGNRRLGCSSKGLSPRVRGNLGCSVGRASKSRVYPRAYGGTSAKSSKRSFMRPRRSIPARTGEPLS